jgi:hypothetical protein
LAAHYQRLADRAVADARHARSAAQDPLLREDPARARLLDSATALILTPMPFRQLREYIGEPFDSAVTRERVAVEFQAQVRGLVRRRQAASDASDLVASVVDAYVTAGFPVGFAQTVPAFREHLVAAGVAEVDAAEAATTEQRVWDAVSSYGDTVRRAQAALNNNTMIARQDGDVQIPQSVRRPQAYGDLLSAVGLPRPALPVDPGPARTRAVAVLQPGSSRRVLVAGDAYDEAVRTSPKAQQSRPRTRRPFGF